MKKVFLWFSNDLSDLRLLLRSSTNIKYIFDIVLFSKKSLNRTLSKIYLILVDERTNSRFKGNEKKCLQMTHCILVLEARVCKLAARPAQHWIERGWHMHGLYEVSSFKCILFPSFCFAWVPPRWQQIKFGGVVANFFHSLCSKNILCTMRLSTIFFTLPSFGCTAF